MNRKLIVPLLIVVGFVSFVYHKQQEGKATYQKFLHAARLTDGLEALMLMENTMRYRYEDVATFPSSNDQVGLGKPEDYANRSLRSASILPSGIIELVFKANTGVDGGVLRYTPIIMQGQRVGQRALRIRWSCETPDYPDVGNLECQYIGRQLKE